MDFEDRLRVRVASPPRISEVPETQAPHHGHVVFPQPQKPFLPSDSRESTSLSKDITKPGRPVLLVRRLNILLQVTVDMLSLTLNEEKMFGHRLTLTMTLL
jgi:hypothetical protein